MSFEHTEMSTPKSPITTQDIDIPSTEDVQACWEELELVKKQNARLQTKKRTLEYGLRGPARLLDFCTGGVLAFHVRVTNLQESCLKVDSLLDAATIAYFQTWCGHFASRMIHVLPREVRDLVYQHMIDMLCLPGHIEEIHFPQSPNTGKIERFKFETAVFDPKFVGPQFADEIRARFSRQIPIELEHQRDIARLMSHKLPDGFRIRVDALRHVIVNVRLVGCTIYPNQRWDREVRRIELKCEDTVKELDHFINVNNPYGFRLEIRLDCMSTVGVATFREALTPFVRQLQKKGVKVDLISFEKTVLA